MIVLIIKKGRITLKKASKIQSPILDETLPHQINFPSYKGSGKKMQEPFTNQYGVVIGDSQYNSPNSPLNHWSDDIDPAIMAVKSGSTQRMTSDGFQKKTKSY